MEFRPAGLPRILLPPALEFARATSFWRSIVLRSVERRKWRGVSTVRGCGPRCATNFRASAKLLAVYFLPVALLLIHVSTALNALGFVPWLGAYLLLRKIEFGFLAVCFLAAGLVFYRNFREAPSGVLRQQLKWLTGGTLAGSLPVSLLYIAPLVFGVALRPWMPFSVLSLVLIPLCFGYAIVRYRLMDVDIIFKRGLAYTAATAAVATVYFALVALITSLFHAQTTGPVRCRIAIV